jgi:hypothetical protein
MKSGKQRRKEILVRRKKQADKREPMTKAVEFRHSLSQMVPVNEEQLAPNNSYGVPDFVTRGYYVDRPFKCVICGKPEIWTGSQQKWWYEVAKGFAYSTAIRCRAWRRKERARRDEARTIHLEGVARKQTVRSK